MHSYPLVFSIAVCGQDGHGVPGGWRRILYSTTGGQMANAPFIPLHRAIHSSIKPFAMQIQLSEADVQRLALVRETIMKNLRYHYTIPTLAQTAGINEFKLKTGFKALYGQPVFDFLTEQRMRMAMELMESNNYSIGEIAHRCGYNHPTNFCAAFRRRYHIRPSDYRKNIPEQIKSAV